MLRVGVLVLVGAGGLALVLLWLLWTILLRPVALGLGWVEPTPHDWTVRGWKAEREGRWADALAAYNEALRYNRRYPDAKQRRADLLARFPELADRPDAPPRLH